MKIVFFGSKASSVEFLRCLIKDEEVAAVVTHPDRYSGRGLLLKPSVVKVFANDRNVGVLLPEKMSGEFVEMLKGYSAELGVVVAYGKIIPETIIKVFPRGIINVHFSLLPEYRGANPIQHALIDGRTKTGVTSFFIDKGMDTGGVILQREILVDPDDDSRTLEEKLVPVGVGLLQETLRLIKDGNDTAQPQKGNESYAGILKKSDGKINWSRPAREVHNLIRGTQPWPGTFTEIKGSASKSKTVFLKILRSRVLSECPGDGITCPAPSLVKTRPLDGCPGEITGIEKGQGFVVRCGNDFLLALRVKADGRQDMSAWDYWQGAHLNIGDKFE